MINNAIIGIIIIIIVINIFVVVVVVTILTLTIVVVELWWCIEIQFKHNDEHPLRIS